MAKDEIRIPIIIDLKATQQQTKVKDETTQQQGEEKASFADVFTGGFLISSGQK